MFPEHAVILAAGNGSRMGALTSDRPKPMLPVGRRTLIERAIAALECAGIRDITVVAGYQQHVLRAHLDGRVRFVENPHYRETNSLYSLWLAAAHLTGGAVILNSDVLFPFAMLDRLLRAPLADALLYDRGSVLDPETMKVKLHGPLVIGMSKDFPVDEADGENVGIVKVGAEGARALMAILDRLVIGGAHTAWAPQAFAELARRRPLGAIDVAGLPWTEIDTPDDLERARLQVVPAISALEAARLCA